MNIKEYISSGIVESYVLGLATEQERSEFENRCSLYPEVREARNIFEMDLEKQAIQSAISPPEALKQKLIEILNPGEKITKFSTRSAISLHSLNWLKYAAAACLVLLAGSIYWNISLYNKNEQLKNTNSDLETRVSNYSSKLAEIDKEAKMLQNPSIKMPR